MSENRMKSNDRVEIDGTPNKCETIEVRRQWMAQLGFAESEIREACGNAGAVSLEDERDQLAAAIRLEGSANEHTDEVIRGVRKGEEAATVADIVTFIEEKRKAAVAAMASTLDLNERADREGEVWHWNRAAYHIERALESD